MFYQIVSQEMYYNDNTKVQTAARCLGTEINIQIHSAQNIPQHMTKITYIRKSLFRLTV